VGKLSCFEERTMVFLISSLQIEHYPDAWRFVQDLERVELQREFEVKLLESCFEFDLTAALTAAQIRGCFSGPTLIIRREAK
jgi:hypothetical protein